MMVVSIEAEATFSSGRPELLFTGDYIHGVRGSYDLSPDGQRFLMIKPSEHVDQIAGQATLVAVENWFSELNRLAPPSP